MPRAAAQPRGRRVGELPRALVAVEERMLTLAAETCPPSLGPVLGEGNPAAALALVGEAPGEREVAAGYPFAGPAGRLLDTLLAEAGLSRAGLWITNVVKCRPVREEKGRLANRTPLAGEIKAWLPLLTDELAVVGPRLLLCLGGTAAKALLGKGFRLTEQRGRWMPGPAGTCAMASFHPAYILHLETHDPSSSRAARETLLLDLREAAARLASPVPPPECGSLS